MNFLLEILLHYIKPLSLADAFPNSAAPSVARVADAHVLPTVTVFGAPPDDEVL